MTELLTAAQMRAIEQAAIDCGAVTGLELMERAGRGVVEAVLDWRPELVLYRWRNGGYAEVSVRAPGRALAYHVDSYPRAERRGHVHAR